MTIKTAETFWVKIYITGSMETIQQVCRQKCAEGLCVTVEPTKYIYTGGEETGAIIGLVNYPRFPSTEEEIFLKAEELALLLLDKSFQDSVMIMSPEKTKWVTKRKNR